MKKLISKLFGESAPAQPATIAASTARKREAAAGAASRDNPLTIQDGSDNATRRQLVQVLLRDVLRRHGIPPHWVELQMLVVESRSRGPGMYVRLVVKHWDERLLNHALAFQNALLADIARFEPKASDWLQGISWELAMGESCPYQTLPDKAFWSAPVPAKAAVTVPVPAAAPNPTDMPEVNSVADIARAAAARSLLSPAAQRATVLATDPESSPATVPHSSGESARRDLESLFMIRDKELARQSADGHAPVGYEKTQPSPL